MERFLLRKYCCVANLAIAISSDFFLQGRSPMENSSLQFVKNEYTCSCYATVESLGNEHSNSTLNVLVIEVSP